jgi:hypothetical protein
MDEEVLNMSIRKFLKKVGVTSQREIEQAIRDAAAKGDVPDTLPAKVSLTIDGIGLSVDIDAVIETR